MPKIKTAYFTHTNNTGETIDFKSDITVDSEGRFSAIVPEAVAIAVQALPGEKVWATRPRQNWRVTGRSLLDVEEAVKAGMEEHLAVDTEVERVIVYSYVTDVSAWADSDGSLHPNGCIGKDNQHSGGRWHPMGQHRHSTNVTAHFQVGVFAAVFDKVTYRRANSEKVEFKQPAWEHSHHVYPTWGSKLNAFITGVPRNLEALPSLPYTEENAKFFFDMMLGLCELGRRMHDFFSDESNVTAAIANGASPLLTHEK